MSPEVKQERLDALREFSDQELIDYREILTEEMARLFIVLRERGLKRDPMEYTRPVPTMSNNY